MSDPVLVLDAANRPLMPMAPAYARKLLQTGRATRYPHPNFTVIRLTKAIEQPILRPIIAILRISMYIAEIKLITDIQGRVKPLAQISIDLYTDLPRRLRRRAGHRRRRREQQRYHGLSRYQRPYKLRRPNLARSRWAVSVRIAHQNRDKSTPLTKQSAPLLAWRAQAVIRTLNALRKFFPISHIWMPDLYAQQRYAASTVSPSQRRRDLIEAYDIRDAKGHLIAVCAFCGRTDGHIEIEHLHPISRGGSNAWSNLALACRDCNRLKGDQTPSEAQMVLRLHHHLETQRGKRKQSYISGTMRLLRNQFRKLDYFVLTSPIYHHLDQATLLSDLTSSQFKHLVAYPVPRPRKQRFVAHNYPLHTSLRSDFVRIGQRVKRLTRVNQALQLRRVKGKIRINVIPVQQTLKAQSYGTPLIRLGMLCTAWRNQHRLMGIVSAIHSSGRLSLRIPSKIDTARIRWRTVVISPRQGLQVMSTEPVIFVSYETNPAEY